MNASNPKEMGTIVSGPQEGESIVSDNNDYNAHEPKTEPANAKIIVWNPNAKPLDCEVSRQFMVHDLAASGIDATMLPDNVRPIPIMPTAEYPNGRYQFPYPFSNGAMYRIRNNLVGSTLPKKKITDAEGRVQQRYDQPSSAQVGTWANAPYIVEAPREGPLYIAEGPKKTLALFTNGLQTVGLAGAFNATNGKAHENPKELNEFLVKHIAAWCELRSKQDPLVLVPDPDAFVRTDIGNAYWQMACFIQEAFPGLPIVCRVFPNKIDDLIGQHGYEKAWTMGETKSPLACLAVPLNSIATESCFPNPLLITYPKEGTPYVAIQDVNAANILAHHPRMAGRYEFDLSVSAAYVDGQRAADESSLAHRMANILAYDLGFQTNGRVLPTGNLKQVIATLSQECGFYPMQRLVKQLPEWDGIKRLDDVGVNYCGLPDTEWSRLWMRSFVLFTLRRGLDVGCDCRLFWLLQGAQLIGKSRLPSTLFGPAMSSIIKTNDVKKEDELIRRLYQAGHIAIIDDMDAFTRPQQAMFKGLVSAGTRAMPEQVRFLYVGEISRVRHFTLYGTANHYDVLNDDLSGNTRYLAVQSGNAKNQVFNYVAIEAERDQMLAEAYAIYQSMRKEDWIAFENELGQKTGEESEWAVQEDENHVKYRSTLEELLKDARGKDDIHEKDNQHVAKGPHRGVDVYAIKSAYLKHILGEKYRGVWTHDVASWLASEGWENSNQRFVLKRKQCWFMRVDSAKERYNLA